MSTTNLSKQELERHIAELEQQLAFFKQALAEIEQKKQHDAIDHLDEHLLRVENRWENLRDFWPVALKEIRELFEGLKKEP